MSMIDFSRPDGSVCRGHLAEAGSGKPGIIVIQQWWGLNPHICDIADRFAAAGFNALAPDLYQGRLAQNTDEAGHLMDGLDFVGATQQDIRGAVLHLQQLGGGKVGVMGFCMGGALTVSSAAMLSGVAAGVCFYGIPQKDIADPAAIRIPFQGHFANKDTWCTPQMVDALEATMISAGNPPQIFRYDVHHAFFNRTRHEVYNAEEAMLAWDRMLPFLHQHLT